MHWSQLLTNSSDELTPFLNKTEKAKLAHYLALGTRGNVLANTPLGKKCNLLWEK